MPRSRILAPAVVLALTAAVVLPTGPTRATEPLPWTCTGPWGGFIFRLQVDETNPDVVLAFTTRGNFLTSDAGETWSLLPQRQHPFQGVAMVLDGGRIWFADEGQLKSSASGKAPWKPAGKLPGLLLGRVRIPGEPAKTIFASAQDDGSGQTAIHVTTPGGASRQIGVIPFAGRGLDHRDAFRSHPAAPATLRLIVRVYRAGLAGVTWLFGSEDGGETWERWSVPHAMNAFAPVPGRAKEWVGVALPVDDQARPNLLRTADGGRTWKAAGDAPGLPLLRTLAFQPETKALFLGTCFEGVIETPDLGETLIPHAEGLCNDSVCALAFDPRKPERVYAGTQSGLYRSDDGGRTWKWASTGLAALQSTDLHVLPDRRVLLLEFQQGPRISEDGGRTWPPFVAGWKKKHGKALGAHVLGSVVVVNAQGPGPGASLSRDSGRTWTPCELPAQAWVLGIAGPESFFAVGREGDILRSRDGIHFEALTGRPDGMTGNPDRILRLAKDRVLLFSFAESADFDPETGKVDNVAALPAGADPGLATVDPVDAAVVWIGTRDGRLHRRRFPDGKWECAVDREGEIFVGLVGDPGRKERRIACFLDGALLRSEDGGATWKPLETPPRLRTAKAIAVTPDRRLLVVADGSVRALELKHLD